MGLVKKKGLTCSVLIGNAHHIGMRDIQQDSFCISDLSDVELCASKGIFAAVADGMGGMADGDKASIIASRTMMQYFNEVASTGRPELDLLSMVIAANENVNRFMTGTEQGGSTVAAVNIRNDSFYWIAVGDSRICLVRGGAIIQINREHIYATDLDEMAARGELSWESAAADSKRTALTSYLGLKSIEKIDRNLYPAQLINGDRILLMSDGIFNTLNDKEILSTMSLSPQKSAAGLMEMTLGKQNPNQDNLTVVILEYKSTHK
ncbi:MAG: serine/threonine-protein phosphatase [Oscillospiraceae bacterium]|nr:serine/threonine-protein phosphatase [Oscillospiraceae bacterium]